MAALTAIAGALGTGLGKFSDWRKAAAEKKVELAKIRASAAESSHKDEAVTYAFLAVFLFVGVAMPLLEFMGFATEALHRNILRSVAEMFEGNFGRTFTMVVVAAVGGERLGKVVKSFTNGKK